MYVRSLAVASDTHAVAVNSVGGYVRTADGGRTWGGGRFHLKSLGGDPSVTEVCQVWFRTPPVAWGAVQGDAGCPLSTVR